MVILGPILAPFAESFTFPDRYDLVAILVEQSLYEDQKDYDGLADKVGGPISSTTIKSRIDRYAVDLQNALPGTRAVIIQVDRFEKTENIAAVLEKLYFEGDPKEPTFIAYLKGAVIIGEVPLPVVNKNNNRFISLFPYTDFEQKVYFWNPASQDFEINADNPNPQPEIWHGVIRPPVSTQIEDGKKLLAAYFDKNHLYHIGDPAYSTFDKKVFFQDFFHEKKNMNGIAYKNYLNFLNHQDDIAYMRYTKELFKDLKGSLDEDISKDQEDIAKMQAELEAQGVEFDSSVPKPDEKVNSEGSPPSPQEFPDIMTKVAKMSDNLMFRFNQVFTKYPNLINDFMKYTGRYLTAKGDDYVMNVDSAINLITAKDQFTINYLKEVNTKIEDKIDEWVDKLQKPVPMLEVKIELKTLYEDIDDKDGIVAKTNPKPLPPEWQPGDPEPPPEYFQLNSPTSFVNFTPAYTITHTDGDTTSYAERLNGYNLNIVLSAEQCTLYRGSKGDWKYSKLVEANRALDDYTGFEYDSDEQAKTGRTKIEKENKYKCYAGIYDGNCQGWEHFGGCFWDGTQLYQNPVTDAQTCFPENATDPVFDIAGVRAIAPQQEAPKDFDNFKSCLDFYGKEQLIQYLDSVDSRLEEIDDVDAENFGDEDDPVQAAREFVIKNAKDTPLKPKELNPDLIPLYTDYVANYEITVGHILRGLGWNPATNPNGWKDVLLKNIILSPIPPAKRKVAINHEDFDAVEFELSHPVEKNISSVIKHKEPVKETLYIQAKNLSSKDLPVDSPRYVTYQSQKGEVEKIIYPDLFKEASFDDYFALLTNVENKLACDKCLQNLIPLLEKVKVTDALNWKDLDIDSKHKYLSEYYIDPAKTAYIGEPKNGYEMLYYNGEGEADRYEFSLNPDMPEEDDAAFKTGLEEQEKLAQEAEAAYEDDPKNPFDSLELDNKSYDLFTWNLDPVSPWWNRIEEWQEDLVGTVSSWGFGKPEKEFYGSLEAENKKALEKIKEESAAVDADPSKADELNFSKITDISLEADSNIVVAAKKIDVKLKLLDKDGKLVNDELAKVNLVLEGAGQFSSDIKDEDDSQPGYQATVFSGASTIGIVAAETTGGLKMIAQVEETEIIKEINFSVVNEAKLVLETSTTGVVADGKSQIEIDVSAVDEANKVIASANGTVHFGLSDELMGKLIEEEIKLINGKGKLHFVASKKKGKVAVNATISTLDSGQLEINLLPGPPVSIGFSAEGEVLPVSPGAQVILEASLFDTNSNMVDTNSSTQIDFRISEKTSKFGNLSSMSEKVTNGIAKVVLTPKAETGVINVIAESKGLSLASITIKSAKQFGQNEISKMKPDALAVALLGIPAGDVSQPNYLAGWFAMNGKVQAVNSLTTQPKQYKKLFEINNKGAVKLAEANRIKAHFLPANNFSLIFTDNKTQTDLAQMTIYTIEEGQFDVTTEADPEKLADGIYIRKTAPDEIYKVDRIKGALRVTKSDSEKVEVQTNGYTRIFDNDFSLRPRDGKFLILEILDKDTPVAEILFVQRFNQDVRIQDFISEAPGIYIQPFKTAPQIVYRQVYSGSSSNEPAGVAFYDKSELVEGSSSPGFAFQSFEDTLNKFGVGFTEDNKFALLFAGGEMFGEANRHYASDIGIVIGDPTVRVNNEGSGSFSKDIGKLIYAANGPVRGLISFDYNTDGYEDILILEGEGKIRLLQNNGGYDQLKNQGFIFDIKQGIADFTKVDVNNDGQMDLVIAGTDSCRKGDTCIDIYENQQGAFYRYNLSFEGGNKYKIITVRAEDLNSDGFPELILADAAGNIKVLYNNEGKFETDAQLLANVGLQVDPNKNLISGVLLKYPGMNSKNPKDPNSVLMYETIENEDFIHADKDFATFSKSTKLGQDLNGGVVEPGDRILYTIILRNDSAALKQGVSVIDVISEQLELDYSSIKCSDCLENEMSIEKLNGHPTQPYIFKDIKIPAKSERHIVYETAFKGDTLAAAKIHITFNNKFKDKDPNLQAGLQKDKYADLAVTKEGNPTGRVLYVYTNGISQDGKLIWAAPQLSSPPEPVTVKSFEMQTGLEVPSNEDFVAKIPVECTINNYPKFGQSTAFDKTSDEITKSEDACKSVYGEIAQQFGLNLVKCRIQNFPKAGQFIETDQPSVKACEDIHGKPGDELGAPPIAESRFSALQSDDSDKDGLQDSVDDLNGALDDLADTTSALISKLTCDAGCIALPMNAAFLAPGFWNIMGTPDGYDLGLPVFGWGAPFLVTTWPPMEPRSTLGGRFYVSPTLTGGVGFGVCFGAYGTPKNCYSFGVNPLDLLPGNICDNLNAVSSAAMSAANSAISKANEGVTLTLGANGGTTGTGGKEASGSGLGNYSLGSYESPVAKSRNIRIPGFPSVITDWWSAQVEEFTDKVLSLPDVYVIYPSGDSLLSAFVPTGDFSEKIKVGNILTNILAWINSIPLIDIESQEVLFKVPAPTRKEIERFKADARQWVEDEKLELDKWLNLLRCFVPGDEHFANLELCNFVDAEMNKLINTVVANMKALDEWILFPKKILQFRAIEAYYLGQIMDYLDTITQFMGGWIKKNIAIVKQWRRTIRQIKQTIKDWDPLPELMIDYQASCDQCKTERYSLMELILKLFAALPSPPVIPLPKLPDIIVDVSKIQAGARIQWPDVKFKPEPLTLPRIPRIKLGVNLNIPLFKLMLPAIPVIPSPPPLPQLPALPPLNLPKLPNLPPPPTLPPLPSKITFLIDILKKIMKIYCMIKLGFMPTDEMLLKTRIEQITARGLTPILPIDLLFTIQSPTISVKYIDQIIVRALMNFQFDLSYVQEQVEKIAQEANKFSTSFAKGVNKFTDALSKQIEKITSPTINIGIPGPEGKQLNYKEQLEDRVQGYVEKYRKIAKELDKEAQKRRWEIKQTPEKVLLKADSVPYEELQDEEFDAIGFDELTQFQKRLKDYRDHLAAYVNDTHDMIKDQRLTAEFDEFSRFLSQQRSAFVAKSLKRYIAGNTESAYRLPVASLPDKQGKAETGWQVGKFDPEDVDWMPEDEGQRELIAYLSSEQKEKMIPPLPTAPGAGGPSGTGNIQDIGLFFIDTDGKGQRLINYTLEANKPSQLADIDIDNDGDSDKVYSYATNVFLKKNAKLKEEEEKPVFRPVDLEFWTIFELLPKGTSPIFPKVVNETSNDASFTFTKSVMENIAGFEIIAKKSPHHFESPGVSDTVRLHLLSEIPAQNLETQEIQTKPVYAYLKSISGIAEFTGSKREYIQSSNGAVKVYPGEILHPMENVEINWNAGAENEQTIKYSQDVMIFVPDSFAEGLNIEVEDGLLEVIRAEKETQPAASGMVLTYGDRIKVKTGSAIVHYISGNDNIINFNEIYILNKAESLDNPLAAITTEPGFYFAKIYSFDAQGDRSTGSEKLLLAPQICSDKTSPFANFGKAKFQVAVGKTLPLNASKSFDSMSKIISYWLDIDAAKDTDGDGAANNDKDLWNKDGSPLFIIGPYQEVSEKQMRLTVQDEALNEGYQDITVEIITPRIVLEPLPLKSNIISGYVEPKEENAPITIAKLRPGKASIGWEILKTPSADNGGQYYTNIDGKFKIEDADLRDRLVVRDQNGKIIAEINSKTGKITIIDESYEMRLIPSQPPDIPMRIGIFLKTDPSLENPLTYVYFVPDVNTDTTIDGPEILYDKDALAKMTGVHIKPLPAANIAGIAFKILPGDDEKAPGAAVVEKGKTKLASIDVNGDVLIFDPAILIRVKQNSNPVVFEMLYNKEIIAEIFIAAHLGASDRVQIVDMPKLPPRPKPIPVKKSIQPFTDVSNNDSFASTAANLFKRGIVAGYPSNVKGQLLFKPQNPINRAEFTQIALKMLCILPREEAKKLPSPFYDVLNPKEWFYPALKEGSIRGFIRGYLGEERMESDGVMRTPFKPANNITWAEAATVVLAALNEEKIIDVSKVDFTAPEGKSWYHRYVEIAQDLKPYLIDSKESKISFVITPDEAALADKPITRKDFALMAERVLLIHDCYYFDSDNDNLPDSWEYKYVTKPQEMQPNDDLDGDKCSNAKEYEIGTDPLKPDTDQGGVDDCTELQHGTNPVDNPYDDKPQVPPELATNEEGIYVLRPVCGNVCPCRATIDSGAVLQPGDIIFAAITGKGGLPIYAKSNEETY